MTIFSTAITSGDVWVLERGVFQQIMMRAGLQKLQDQLGFLRTVPLFSKMSDDQLLKLTDAFEVVRASCAYMDITVRACLRVECR